MARSMDPNAILLQSLMGNQGIPPSLDMGGMPATPQAPVPAVSQVPQSPAPQGQQNMIQSLLNNPEAMIRLGAAIGQPIDRRTQTPQGHISNALTGSMDYLQQLKDKEAAAALLGQKMSLEERKVATGENAVGVQEQELGLRQKELGQKAEEFAAGKGKRDSETDLNNAKAWYYRNKAGSSTEAGAKKNYAESYAEALWNIDQRRPVGSRKYQAKSEATADAVQFLETTGNKQPAAVLADFWSRNADAYAYGQPAEKETLKQLADELATQAGDASPYKSGELKPGAAGAVGKQDLTGNQDAVDKLPSGTKFIWGGKEYTKE